MEDEIWREGLGMDEWTQIGRGVYRAFTGLYGTLAQAWRWLGHAWNLYIEETSFRHC